MKTGKASPPGLCPCGFWVQPLSINCHGLAHSRSTGAQSLYTQRNVASLCSTWWGETQANYSHKATLFLQTLPPPGHPSPSTWDLLGWGCGGVGSKYMLRKIGLATHLDILLWREGDRRPQLDVAQDLTAHEFFPLYFASPSRHYSSMRIVFSSQRCTCMEIK